MRASIPASFGWSALLGGGRLGGAALLLTGGAYGTYDLGYYEFVLTTSGSSASQGLSGALGLLKSLIMLPITLFINYKVRKIEPVEF